MLSFDWFRWLAVANCSYCVLVVKMTLVPAFAKGKKKVILQAWFKRRILHAPNQILIVLPYKIAERD